MVTLNTIFDLRPGNDLELCYLTPDDNGIDFVSRTSKNNGVSSKVAKIYGVESIPGGTISVSMGGSVMEAFFHENEYYTGYHIKVLVPKTNLSINQIIFYCMCIRANKFKYSFGRQANKTISSILVPDINEIPSWVEKDRETYVKDIPIYFLEEGYEKACWYLDNIDHKKFEDIYEKKQVSKYTPKIDLDNWKYICLSDLFKINTGKDLIYSSLTGSDYNVVGQGRYNNGVTCTTNFLDDYPLYNCNKTISLAHIGNFFATVQEYDFYAGTRVKTLEADFSKYGKEYLNYENKNVLSFIATIINQEGFRYSYGRVGSNKIPNINIKLPCMKDKKGEYVKVRIGNENKETYVPDFKYMDDYIKSLKYSLSLLE
jgi:hypothetical protein